MAFPTRALLSLLKLYLINVLVILNISTAAGAFIIIEVSSGVPHRWELLTGGIEVWAAGRAPPLPSARCMCVIDDSVSADLNLQELHWFITTSPQHNAAYRDASKDIAVLFYLQQNIIGPEVSAGDWCLLTKLWCLWITMTTKEVRGQSGYPSTRFRKSRRSCPHGDQSAPTARTSWMMTLVCFHGLQNVQNGCGPSLKKRSRQTSARISVLLK